MRKVALVLLVPACAVLADDDAQHVTWMKQIGNESGIIRKAEPKTGDTVAASAEKIATAYGQTKTLWEKRNAPDALKAFDDGKAAAIELASAAKAGEAEKANGAFRTLSGTCKSCHDVHREKLPDGTYKIK